MKELISYLIEDMKQPITYIPAGIVVGILLAGIIGLINKITKKKMGFRKLLGIWLLCIYSVVVIIQTFFSREPGSRSGIDLELFSTWGVTWQAHAYVIENVIMFLPLGILIPMSGRRHVRFREILFISAALSILIENVQLFTGRGFCQLDDVVMNVLGGCLGYVIYQLANWLFRKN